MAPPGPATNAAAEPIPGAPGSARGAEEQAAAHRAYSSGGIAFYSRQEMLFEPPPRGRGWIFTAWVFCAVGTVTLLVPLGFTLLPLLTRPPSNLPRGVSKAPNVFTTIPQGSVKISVSTSTTKTTVIPLTCVRPTPAVNDSIDGIDTRVFHMSSAPRRTANVYCLYNNTRIRKNLGHDFLPIHLPWEFCPNVLYWSIGISKTGLLVMRAPRFEKMYGLLQLRSIIDNRRPDVKVTITIGGYPEDAGLLYQLGPGTKYEHNLAQLLLEGLHKYRFNGLNIHLVEDPPCEPYLKEKFQRLGSLIDTFVGLVNLNYATSPFPISIMVGTNERLAEEVLRQLGSRIEKLFFDSHELIAGQSIKHVTSYCNNYSTNTKKFFSKSFGVQWSGRLCGSFPFLFRSTNCSYCQEVSAPLPVTQREGYASYLDVCAMNYSVKSTNYYPGSCDRLEVYGLEHAIFIHSGSVLANAFYRRCVLLDSVDYDAVPKDCTAVPHWTALERFYAAVTTT